MKKLILITAILLPGCATHWAPSSPYQQQDLAECEYQAALATGGMANQGFQAGYNEGVLTRKCMNLKGYQLR